MGEKKRPILITGKSGTGKSTLAKTLVAEDVLIYYANEIENKDWKSVEQDIIIEEVKSIMLEPGRKILILSDRRDHLKYIYSKLIDLDFDVGFYLGGMKQKDLASLAGVDETTLYRHLNGTIEISRDIAIKYAKVLGCDPAEILFNNLFCVRN